MSLQTRLVEVVQAIGADVKLLREDIAAASGPESLDGGDLNTAQDEIIDAGTLA